MTTLGLRDLGFVAASSGVLWTPARITTALWLDAADSSTVTTVSGAVSQWSDKSGNGRNMSQSNSAQRPIYTSNGQNGRNVLTFDGSQWLTSANAASTWNFLHQTGGAEIVMLCKVGTSSDPNSIYSLVGSNGGTGFNEGIYQFYDDRASVPRNNKIGFLAANSSQAYIDVSADNAVAPNVATLIGLSLDLGNATASNKVQHIVNGSALPRLNTDSSSPSINTATYALQIGANGNNGSALVGYIAECIICSSKQSDANRQRIEGYLAHKWGLTASLPSGHPYKSTPPTV